LPRSTRTRQPIYSISTVMAEKHSALLTSYNAFFHGLGQNRPLILKAQPI
jgi:hypothetical protein